MTSRESIRTPDRADEVYGKAARRCLFLLCCGALAWAFGCGARTGLYVDDRDRPDTGPDDDADIHGDFPCNYSRVGELVPLVSTTPSADPDLAWGDSNLGVSFAFDYPVTRSAACVTSEEHWFPCAAYDEPSMLGPGGTRIAWDGEAFGVCWQNREALTLVQFQRYSTSGSPLWPEPAAFHGVRGPCRELIWAESHFLVALSSSPGVPILTTQVFSLDRGGNLGSTEILRVPGYHGEDAPFAMASDGDIAAAAWISIEGLIVRSLQGTPDSEIAFLRWPDSGHLALALRGTLAALVWATVHDGTFRLFVTLADLDTGAVADATEVGSGDGYLAGVDIVRVGEGFVIAWSQHHAGIQREVVVPTRTHEGPSLEVREEIVIYEGNLIEIDSARPTSLTYNGLDLFIAITAREDYEVLIQRLACHR